MAHTVHALRQPGLAAATLPEGLQCSTVTPVEAVGRALDRPSAVHEGQTSRHVSGTRIVIDPGGAVCAQRQQPAEPDVTAQIIQAADEQEVRNSQTALKTLKQMFKRGILNAEMRAGGKLCHNASILPQGVGHLLGQAPEFFGFVV